MNEINAKAPNFFDQFLPSYEALFARIWSRDKVRFDSNLYSISRNILQRAFSSGFGSVTTDLNAPDHLRISLQEANIARFAAAKTAKQVIELNRLLQSHKTFDSFSKAANQLNITYNNAWLKAEYDTAFTTAQANSDYFRHQQSKNVFPYLQFDTVGDGRVRDEHAKLDGMIVKVGSSQHDLLNPPLGYNCRCRWRQMLDSEIEEKDIVKQSDIVKQLKSTKVGKQTTYDIMQKYGFDKNKAKVNEVFSNAQFHIKNFKESGLSHKDYGLTDYKSMRNNLYVYKPDYVNNNQWFNDRIGMNNLSQNDTIRLTDFRRRPILWERKHFKFEDPTIAENVISNPDEVWLTKNGKVYQRQYLKFWNDKAVRVQVDLSNDLSEQITKAEFVKNVDSFRKGVLVK